MLTSGTSPAQTAGTTGPGLERLLPPAVLVALAGWWSFVAMAVRRKQEMLSYDIYAAHYPNALYALRSLREGHGLLWNAEQNCGQPFLPSTLVGPFYPANALLLLLGPDLGLQAAAFVHLAAGGIGTYALGRELGLARASALCGGIAFGLGHPLLHLAGWLPVTILGSFVWLPWAMLLCERTLGRPTVRRSIVLGVILTLQLLGAYPQMLLFTYQLLLLRLAWEAVTMGPGVLRRAAGPLVLALLLPVALGAIHLLPAAEFAALSLRSVGLQPDEVNPSGMLQWSKFRALLAGHYPGAGRTIMLPGAALGLLGLLVPSTRRQAGFYLLVVALTLGLTFDTPLYRLYTLTPLAGVFRHGDRFLYLGGFAASVLTALGAEAIVRGGRAGLLARLAVMLTAAAGLFLVAGTSPWPMDVAVLVALVLALMVAGSAARERPAALLVLLAVATFSVHTSRRQFFAFVPGGELLEADRATLDVLRQRMTSQDRWYPVAGVPRYGLTDKTASAFGLPSITDYEPQTSLLLANLHVMMVTNRPLTNINQHYVQIRAHRLPKNRRLLDLLATRYLVVEQGAGPLPDWMQGSLQRVHATGDVEIFENPRAVPRATFVPRAIVEPDDASALRTLAAATHDPREAVLLATPPPDDFRGTAGATGEVTFEEDGSERVRLRVRASAPGFLVLTDQDYPGWTATVNGRSTPVLRANYAFRAVVVPAGESSVEFTYRPGSLRAGAALSLLTAVALVVLWRRS